MSDAVLSGRRVSSLQASTLASHAAALAKSAVALIREWHRRYRSRLELAAYGHHERGDLGYAAELDAEVAKPFWRVEVARDPPRRFHQPKRRGFASAGGSAAAGSGTVTAGSGDGAGARRASWAGCTSLIAPEEKIGAASRTVERRREASAGAAASAAAAGSA